MKTTKSKQRHVVSRKRSKSSLPRLLSAADALKSPPPVAWCVEGLFQLPSLNMLVGASGSRKTTLAVDLAVCVALGKPWLGRLVDQAPVLFLDEQTGPQQLWARFNAALLAHGTGENGAQTSSSIEHPNLPTSRPPDIRTPLHYTSMVGYSLKDKDSLTALQNRVTEVGAHLVIFDAFSNFVRRGSESSFTGVQPALFNLRRLSAACNAAILLLHHSNREGLPTGVSTISAAMDLLLLLESKPSEDRIKITAQKSRFQLPQPFFARAVYENDPASSAKIFLKKTRDPADVSYWWHRCPYPRDSTEVNLLHLFDRHNGRATSMEIRINQGGSRKVLNALQRLIEDGIVARLDDGKQGEQALYEFPKRLDEVWPDPDF